jgi:hypothetical protein
VAVYQEKVVEAGQDRSQVLDSAMTALAMSQFMYKR